VYGYRCALRLFSFTSAPTSFCHGSPLTNTTHKVSCVLLVMLTEYRELVVYNVQFSSLVLGHLLMCHLSNYNTYRVLCMPLVLISECCELVVYNVQFSSLVLTFYSPGNTQCTLLLSLIICTVSVGNRLFFNFTPVRRTSPSFVPVVEWSQVYGT
jgi:hypothetical protein